MGPQPFEGAPQEAYKQLTTFDGGVDFQTLGSGTYAGRTSNILEIMVMLSTAQSDSTLLEYDDKLIEPASNDSILGKFLGFGQKLLTAFNNTKSEMAQKLRDSCPALDRYWTKKETDKYTKTMLSYAKPLFDASHQLKMGIDKSKLPTKRTAGLENAGNINVFNQIQGNGASDTDYNTSKIQAEMTAQMLASGKQIWMLLAARGLSPIHCAGILGNFFQECRWKPGLEEYPGKQKGGLGLGQWTGLKGGRRTMFENYFAKKGTNWKTDVAGQIDFMFEHDEKYRTNQIQQYCNSPFSSIEAATRWLCNTWEQPNAKYAMMETRIAAGVFAYNNFANLTGGESMIQIDQVSGISSTGSAGVASSFDSSVSTFGTGTIDPEASKPASEEVHKSHTPNLDDEGKPNELYMSKDPVTSEVFTFEGADYLTVDIWYSTKSTNLSWVAVYDGTVPPRASNYDKSISQKLGGGGAETKETASHDTFEIKGEKVQFFYKASTAAFMSYQGDYGYYAEIRPHGNKARMVKKTVTVPAKEASAKYVSSRNVDSEGKAKTGYTGPDTQTVKIDGATELEVELWYGMGRSDYLTVYNQDVTGMVQRDKMRLSDKHIFRGGDLGNPMEKPADDSSYHTVFTVSGDTASFDIRSSRTYTSYGYFAKVTDKNAPDTEVQKEIEVPADSVPSSTYVPESGALSNIVMNVTMCPDVEHKGYGCASFDKFAYNDIDRKSVYYQGIEMEDVQPAALVFPDKFWACNIPDETNAQFFEAIDHCASCWEMKADKSGSSSGYGTTSTASTWIETSEPSWISE